MSYEQGKLIRISTELHTKLGDLCHKSQSYGDLVQAMYNFYMKYNFDKTQENLINKK